MNKDMMLKCVCGTIGVVQLSMIGYAVCVVIIKLVQYERFNKINGNNKSNR